MLVSYDEEGNALRTQAAASAGGSARVEVLSCVATDKRKESVRDVAKAKLFEALHVCARTESAVTSQAKVQVEGDPNQLKTCRVMLREHAPAFSLLFLPLVPTVSCITEESQHPQSVRCQVVDGGVMAIAPYVRLLRRDAALAAARKGQERDWVVPFWLMRRAFEEAACNCVMTEIQVDAILTGGVCGGSMETTSPRAVFDSHFKLPAITNCKKNPADTELVLQMTKLQPKMKASAKKVAPPLKRAREDAVAPDSQENPESQTGG